MPATAAAANRNSRTITEPRIAVAGWCRIAGRSGLGRGRSPPKPEACRCPLNSRAIRLSFATRRPTVPRSSWCPSGGCLPSTAWAIRERQGSCSQATPCEPPTRPSERACSGSTATRSHEVSSSAHGGPTPNRRARTSPHRSTVRRGTGNRCWRSVRSRRRGRAGGDRGVPNAGPSSPAVRLIQFAEGRAAQILHVGGPATEYRSVVALYDAVNNADCGHMATCTKFAFRTTSAFLAIGLDPAPPDRDLSVTSVVSGLGRVATMALHPAQRDAACRWLGPCSAPRAASRCGSSTASGNERGSHRRARPRPAWVRQRTLVLERDAKGNWTVDGAKVRALKGATDVDLGTLRPALPIRRLRLGVEASKKAAWVRFPELTVVKADQKYTRLDEFTYRYKRRLRGGTHRRRRGPRRRRGLDADGRRHRPG